MFFACGRDAAFSLGSRWLNKRLHTESIYNTKISDNLQNTSIQVDLIQQTGGAG